MDTIQFPIQFPYQFDRRNSQHTDEIVSNCPTSIPWVLIAPHEAQAERNHGQSLRRLAERQGLSPCESVAILEDRLWHRMDRQESINRLNEIVSCALKLIALKVTKEQQ